MEDSRKKIIITPYQKRWADDFITLKNFITPIMSTIGCHIEHVGSTSVVGLSAKPIIDCDIVIRRTDFACVLERLSMHGFDYRGDLGILDRHAFFGPDLGFKYHLYVTFKDAEAYHHHLYLKHWLSRHHTDAMQYQNLKIELSETYPNDIDRYIDGKTALITSIYQKAKQSIILEPTILEELDVLEHINLSYQDMIMHNGVAPEPHFVKKCFVEGDLPPVDGASKACFDLLTIKDYLIQPLGFVMAYRGYPNKDTMWISLMVIDPSHQGKGYGHQTIKHLTEYAKEKKMHHIGVGVSQRNERGLNFWHHVGFTKIRTYTLLEGNPPETYLFDQLEKDVNEDALPTTA